MIEAVMLIVVLISFSMVIIRSIRETGVASKMVTEPWKKVAGMAEFGVWAEANDANRKKHPNTYDRFYTPERN